MLPVESPLMTWAMKTCIPYAPRYAALTPGSFRSCAEEPVERHAARFQHVSAVRAVQRLVRVLLRKEDRVALAVELREDCKDVVHHDGRKADGRLVHHDEARRRHERAADGEHLPLTAAQGAGHLVTPLLEDREPLVDPFQAGGDVAHVVMRAQEQVVEHASWKRKRHGPPAPGTGPRARCGQRKDRGWARR